MNADNDALLTKLFNESRRILLGYMINRAGRAADVENMAGDAMLRVVGYVCRHPDYSHSYVNLRNLLMVAAEQVFIDYVRRVNHSSHDLVHVVEGGAMSDDSRTVVDAVEQRDGMLDIDTADMLEYVMGGLTATERRAFELFFYYRLTGEQMAQVMGCGFEAAKSSLRRARVKMQRKLPK